MVEIKITYETLFDLLRREKSKNELQGLDATFYADVVSYLRSKKELLDNPGSTTSKAEQEKIMIQIKNIKRILRELYELRAKKILNLAMNKVRTDSNLLDTSKLLPEERIMYEEANLLLSRFKSGILQKIFDYELPSVSKQVLVRSELGVDEQGMGELASRAFKEDDKELTKYKIEEDLGSELKMNSLPDTVKVRFLSDLPKFMGLDNQVYGPFQKGTICELPKTIADLLSKKGRVELI